MNQLNRAVVLFLVVIFSVIYLSIGHSIAKSINNGELDSLTQKYFKEPYKSYIKLVRGNSDPAACYELAKFFIAESTIVGRERARNLLRKAIWKDKKNIKYRLLNAKLYEKMRINSFREYKKIIKIDSTVAEAWFHLGLIKEKEYNEFHHSKNLVGSIYLSFEDFTREDFQESEYYLKKAIHFDSLHNQAYLHLGFLYEEAGMPEKGITYLEKLVELDPENKDARLYLGLLYYKANNMGEAYREYQEAISLMSEEDKSDFIFYSAKILLDPVLKEDFSSMDEAEIFTLIQKYWYMNDPLYLTKYNERLLEHYSRVAYTNLRFSVPGMNITGWKSDRGEIVLRYGEPINRIRLRPGISGGLQRTIIEAKTEIWYFEDMVFGYTDDYLSGNYRFSIPGLPGNTIQPQFSGDSQMLADEMRRKRPEQYHPKFEGPEFYVPFDIVQFRNFSEQKQGYTDVYVNYGLNFVDSLWQDNKPLYDHEYGLFLFDKDFNKLFEKRSSVSAPLSDHRINETQNIIVNSIYMTVKPDSGYLAFEVKRDHDRGISSNHGKLKIEHFSSYGLNLSDIVLATYLDYSPDQQSSITRKDIKLLPNPTHIFSKEEDLYIYYEIYNLWMNENDLSDFEQRISLMKAEEFKEISGLGKVLNSLLSVFGIGKDGRITLSSRYRTADKNPQMYLQLDMDRYESGDYILRLTIKDNISGQKVSRETTLTWQQFK